MHILMATSECAPFIKTGGLGDVVGSLPQALMQQGHQCIVVLPLYKTSKHRENMEYITSYDIYVGSRKKYCGIFKYFYEGIEYYFIDNEEYFNRDQIYGYDDDEVRFGYFDFAVLELISHLQLNVDILHCHDWQSAMIIPLYYQKYCTHPYYENIKTMFTIHNIAYQGKCNPSYLQDIFGIPYELYENFRNDDCFNMMKSAIVYSNYITTVSPSYACEILSHEYGEGLQYILNYRKDDLFGIVNGIDDQLFNPKTDLTLSTQYDCDHLDLKLKNKVELQKQLGVQENQDIPMIGIVTRLTWQKGIDLILQEIHHLMKKNIQVVLLGTGDYHYEDALYKLGCQYPNKLKVILKYDFVLSNQIYGASDMFLMPSLFEPCGLSQLMAMRYGSLPIVRETGGLKDTVMAYNQYTGAGDGFSFKNYSGFEMMNCINYALETYQNKEVWYQLVKQAMTKSLNWTNSAKSYLHLYQKLMIEK